MKTNEIYILEDRGILYIQGSDSEEFLQNIITNDVKKITDKKKQLCVNTDASR